MSAKPSIILSEMSKDFKHHRYMSKSIQRIQKVEKVKKSSEKQYNHASLPDIRSQSQTFDNDQTDDKGNPILIVNHNKTPISNVGSGDA